MEKSPIRIIQYIGSLNIGGSQSMIMEMYRKLDKSKIQFDFIIDRKNENFYEEEIVRLGGIVYKFDNYFKGTNYFNFQKQWNEFFKKHKEYKIIHCHVRSVASIVLKIAQKNNVITICHSHSTSNGNGFSSILKKILQKKIPKYSDYLFACSKESGEWLFGKSFDNSENCYIINNAIDSEKYIYNKKIRNEQRKKYGIDDKFVIGQVGRLIEIKNHDFTIELLKKLNEESNKKFFLLIIGTGPLKGRLLKKIKDYKLENSVKILENRNDVNDLLQAMDVYIMPSLWEGLPLSLVEAQASGLPCVISKNITSGILDNDLVTQLDLKDEAQKWTNLIKNVLNKVRKDESKLIINNRFDIKTNVKLLEKFYLDIIE